VEIPLCVLPVDALLRAAGDTRFLLGFNVARLIGTVALVAAGIALDGLAGAILGAIAGESLARLALLARGRRYLGVRSAAALLDWPWLARVALASALACAPAWLMERCLGPGVAALVAAVAAYGMSYAVLRQLLIRRAPGAGPVCIAATGWCPWTAPRSAPGQSCALGSNGCGWGTPSGWKYSGRPVRSRPPWWWRDFSVHL